MLRIVPTTSRGRCMLFCRRFCSQQIAQPDSKDKSHDEQTVVDVLADLRKPELSEEDVMQKRFKARIPEFVYRKQVAKEAVPLVNKYDFEIHRLRRFYAKFGKATNLNPGICWPSREQVKETMEYDNIFDPPLKVKLKNIEDKRLKVEQEKKAVEEEVDRNMSNLDNWMAEYYKKIEKKKRKTIELKQEREKLVEEISEYLGYDIDPRDPRFKEAVEQRDKARKKEMKAKKQQESYDKMLDKLRKIAQSKK